MRTETLYSDGTKPPRGMTIHPDHYLTTFEVPSMTVAAGDKIREQFKITKYKWGYLTIQSMSPDITDRLSKILGKEVKAIDQQIIVKKHWED